MQRDDEWHELRDRLTKSGHEWLNTDDGKVLAERQGLLPQLRTAIFGGMEGTGGTSSFGSKPPLDTAAVDLLDEITNQAAQVLAKVDPHPTPLGTAEHYVNLWAGQTTESQRFTIKSRAAVVNFEYDKKHPERPSVFDELSEYSAIELLRRWVARVEDFFNPPSGAEIPAACPSCGARHVHRMRDGEWIQTGALNFVRDRLTGRTTEAKCGAPQCGVSWPPSQFEFLAKLVGAGEATPIVEERAKAKARVLSEPCFIEVHGGCESMRCQCDCHMEGHAKKSDVDTPVNMH